MSNINLLKLLGKLGANVPCLTNQEWDSIFEFLDYYTVVSEEKTTVFTNFNWYKVKEILILLSKVQD